jgi:HEAT repeat protein
MGPGAAPAMNALVQALSDSSWYVRVPAADALGNIGPAAKSAVGALSDRLLSPDEQVVFVQRSLAQALGNIGPDAAAALPALERASEIHRVSYTAEEAIHKIKGEPVPSWY